MPRANRHVIPNHVWHLTHRCHNKQWLLKFAKDRQRWLYWLFVARRQFGLCVLNYMVASNHIHLLVRDRGKGEIWRSMQLIAVRTAQEYNHRKNRHGAFWEDRYHSTAVGTDKHLHRCLTYIDMNMVRAGAVSHPDQWNDGGVAELRNPNEGFQRVDYVDLIDLLNLYSINDLRQSRLQWIEEAMQNDQLARNPIWTDSGAVGSELFETSIPNELGLTRPGRKVEHTDCVFVLLEAKCRLYRVNPVENEF